MHTIIAYFISSHGFGHAARSSAVINSLSKIIPNLQIEIFTKTPEWFFKETLTTDFHYHELINDIGLIQDSPFQENLPATVEALSSFLPINQELTKKYAQTLKKLDCNLVINDISPFGISIAKQAKIPAVIIENFTWEWIYQPYIKEFPAFDQFIEQLKTIYAQVNYHIQTEPICKTNSNADFIATTPISRSPLNSREATRKELGLSEQRKVILLTMGGIEGKFDFLEQLQKHPEITFIIPGGSPDYSVQGNLILFPHHSKFYHPDLINCSDAVVGKVGYSTIAETFHTGIPFGYVSRNNFRESHVLERYVQENMTGIPLSEKDYLCGDWLQITSDLINLPKKEKPAINGADQVSRFISTILE